MRFAALLAGLLLAASPAALADEHVWPVGDRAEARHPGLEVVRYEVSIENAVGHLLAVTMIIDGYSDAPLDVAMPVWAPGAYRVTVPARNLLRLRAWAGSSRLRVEQLDRTTWRVHEPPSDGPVVLRYSVYHPDPSVVRSHVARDYASISGFDTFLYVVGNLGTACELRVVEHAKWSLVTGLPRRRGVFVARTYDVLVDSPILWGALEQRAFDVAGRRHHLVWSGDSDYDIDRLAEDTRRIVEAVHPMFGGPLPYEDYWFLWRFLPGGGGGLEHLNSTRINDGPTGYEDPDELDRHWRVTSHEFVHTWNVKRIRPARLGPFDYTREQYTTYLWFAEGFTSYLGDLALLRAGIWSEDRYLRSLAAAIDRLRSAPAAAWMSARQASFTTWHKAQNGDAGRINYYNKGLLIALLLDLRIRRATDGSKELTDLMGALYDGFRLDGRAFGDGAVRTAAERICGESLEAFFRDYVEGTATLPFDEALHVVGLKVEPKPGREVATLGVSVVARSDAEVTRVEPGSVAEGVGIQNGDVIAAVGGRRVTGKTLRNRIQKELRPGDQVEVLFYRGEVAKRVDVVLGNRVVLDDPSERESFRKVPIRLSLRADETAAQRAARERWLRVTAKFRISPAESR